MAGRATKDFMAVKIRMKRIGAKNVPVAYSPDLEEAILPQSSDILKAIRETARY